MVPQLYKLYIRRVKLMECDVGAKSSELTAFRPMFLAVFVFFQASQAICDPDVLNSGLMAAALS